MHVRRTLATTVAASVALGVGATAAQAYAVHPGRTAVPGSTLILWSPDHVGHSNHGTVELELVSPTGVRQSIASLRSDARIADWSRDGKHALVISGQAGKLSDVTIATGQKVVIAQAHVSSASFAGSQVVVQKGEINPSASDAKPGAVEMFPATPQHGSRILSTLGGRVLTSPDGEHVAVGESGPVTVLGTFHPSSEVLATKGFCTPQRWSDSRHLVVSCFTSYTSSRTFSVDVGHNTVTQLTDAARGRQDFDAWKLGSSTVFATFGPCGTTLLSRRIGTGVEHIVSRAGDDVLPIGVTAGKVVMTQPAGCGMGGSLATYDPRDGSITEIVTAPKALVGVTQAVLFVGKE